MAKEKDTIIIQESGSGFIIIIVHQDHEVLTLEPALAMTVAIYREEGHFLGAVFIFQRDTQVHLTEIKVGLSGCLNAQSLMHLFQKLDAGLVLI